MARRASYFLLILALLALPPRAAHATPPKPPQVEASVQGFLDGLPGPLRSYRDGDQSAAEIVQAVSSYYNLSPRLLLALLEATGSLLSAPSVPDATLRQPFGTSGPDGFAAQIDWAGRELRAGYGPYQRPPTIQFTDGTTLTLTLNQAPEGVAVQRFLAYERTQAEWRAAFDRFTQAFQQYFDNELPATQAAQPAATHGFLQRPWQQGTRVVHLAQFDHMFPTVDTGGRDNGYVVNYLGRGGMQYDGHDGHDFTFPDQPVGTLILAAADGVAYARTHRGFGVVITHPGGYETVYWHLDKFASMFKGRVDTDQGVPVKAGDVIGSSGKTGFATGTPHLHFEVRHNGREVDPYGWYGPGADPCAAYAACEASTWLWSADLAGDDFTPPGTVAAADTTPPEATISAAPPDELLFLAQPAESPLQLIGYGTPILDGGERTAYPTAGNLDLHAGTITMRMEIPQHYAETRSGRSYLLASSAAPDEGPVYTGTLALRRETAEDGTARWNFWTTPDQGDAGRNDLTAPDTLAPGPHQIAISWDQAARSKALFVDGQLVATVFGVALPEQIGPQLDLGRFAPGQSPSGIVISEFMIEHGALTVGEIGRRAKISATPATPVTHTSLITVDTNAMDDAGGIASVQLGVDDVFGDPLAYADSYRVALPSTGTHVVAARFADRAGNTRTVTTTVTYTPPDVMLPLVMR